MVENWFEAGGGGAADLAESNFPEKSHPDFVGDAFVGELLLGLSDEGNLGSGVNTVGIIRAVRIGGHAEGSSCGDASLPTANRAEAREIETLADGDYVRPSRCRKF